MTQLLIDRATLEQLVVALNEVDQHVDLKRYDTAPNEVLFDVVMAALTAGRAALAQQELPQKERPDFMAGYDAGMADAKRMAQQGEQRCTYCDGTGDVHSIDGEWRGSCPCAAAPAPQPAQPLLAHLVLKLNALWNKSSVKDSAIADQLAVCRALAESEDDMELTDAQILTLWEETYVQRGWTGIEFARAIERAHGIGVNQ